MNKKSIKDVELVNKTILVRCDFNVPLDGKGNITDDLRIKEALPTIKYLIKNNNLVLCSHLRKTRWRV